MKTYKAVLADNPQRVIILPHEMTATGASYVAGNMPANYPVPATADLMPAWFYSLAEVELNPVFEELYHQWQDENFEAYQHWFDSQM
jgi:hypothetical protein